MFSLGFITFIMPEGIYRYNTYMSQKYTNTANSGIYVVCMNISCLRFLSGLVLPLPYKPVVAREISQHHFHSKKVHTCTISILTTSTA